MGHLAFASAAVPLSRRPALPSARAARPYTTPSMSAAARKRVVIVGAGWAGLGAALHLSRLDLYHVTLLESGASVGGLVAGSESDSKPREIGIHGAWRPYRNLFRVCDDLGIRPFTDWTRSDSFSPRGRETSAPIFADLPRLPTPLGTLLYTQFWRVGLRDRLSALPLLRTLADFDPRSKADWVRYDRMTARELLRTNGVSPELARLVNSMLVVGTFCNAEETSAAACLAFLYFFILQEQSAFDVVWPRGTSGEMIFAPLADRIQEQGAVIRTQTRVSDYQLGEDGKVTGVVCGDELIPCDVVVSAVGITGLQGILRSSKALSSFEYFRKVNKLNSIDVLAVRMYLDRYVKIDKPSNALFGFDDGTGGTLFHLNDIHDRYRDEKKSVIECDFYGSQQLTPMSDEEVVRHVQHNILSKVYSEYGDAVVEDFTVMRVVKGVTGFRPGSHQFMLERTSPIPNFFNCGDWIWTDHGSFSQERALVTGLQAANAAVDALEGKISPLLHAEILDAPAPEPHVDAARKVAKKLRDFKESVGLGDIGWL